MRPSLRHLTTTKPPSPSRARSKLPLKSLSTPPLTLESFLLRQRALSLYRTILRSLYRIPKHARAEPVAWAKGEFDRNKGVSDAGQIRYLISTGKTEFEGMGRYIDELGSRG